MENDSMLETIYSLSYHFKQPVEYFYNVSYETFCNYVAYLEIKNEKEQKALEKAKQKAKAKK